MKNMDLKLLPHKFKIVGYVLLAISLVLFIISSIDLIAVENEIIKNGFFDLVLIAFLVLALSKEKVEDERSMKLRLLVFAATFLYGVIFALISPLGSILFNGSFEIDLQANQLLFTMFLWYFGVFYFMKRFN
ncbi:MAG: hypothetical protein CMP12_22110 [Zunongwangia sp.]|jgi:hypothetical protein|uniref:Uncharacterized protein n=1 Tax=Zunongwangia profunda TaxID=398743 RepID=A0A3D5J3Z1_9FLAO|nr:hypothetical protein [Zunongwangia profunda]MAC64584.1 hypothetical protein [Flavobacteriaceae bacterium]MAO38558.1 hypothetical protein [Zunongwangia sp.]MAG89096.1 hypothetical protein [Flavobacteriaceae bacterium]MAS71878.1 hypothetical protein [Zunongwangia sp.]MCC4230801.1 hypothetical protein [Zunongwangia profunda]|tara:strand:+ start:1445 stop:1840 length:396 start_codon:yes stop_codon:yes gene_type:complete